MATFFQVGRERFRLLAGDENLQRYRSSPWAQRVFCKTCGSSLFGEPDGVPALGIALGSMLGPIDREPHRHICWDDRASWVRIGDDLPRLSGPGFEAPISRARYRGSFGQRGTSLSNVSSNSSTSTSGGG